MVGVLHVSMPPMGQEHLLSQHAGKKIVTTNSHNAFVKHCGFVAMSGLGHPHLFAKRLHEVSFKNQRDAFTLSTPKRFLWFVDCRCRLRCCCLRNSSFLPSHLEQTGTFPCFTMFVRRVAFSLRIVGRSVQRAAPMRVGFTYF